MRTLGQFEDIRKRRLTTLAEVLFGVSLLGFVVSAASADLVWHTRAPELLGAPIPFMRVAYGQGMFVAAGYDGTFAVSTDGIYWQTNMPTNAVPWIGLGYAAGTFVAVGGFPTTFVSSVDGSNWVQQPFPDVNAVPRELGAANNRFWLCVQSGVDQARSLFRSATGTNWLRTALEFFSAAQGVYYSVAYGGGLYTCVGWDTSFFGDSPFYSAPTILISEDGSNWVTELTGVDPADPFHARDGTALRRVTYGEGLFVAAANNCHQYLNNTAGRGIWSSRDGTNWSYELTTFPDLRSVSYGNGVYVAVGGYDGENPGVILYSTDALLWNSIQIPSTNALRDVVYGKNTFVAVGDFGQIFQSDPVLSLKMYAEAGQLMILGPVGETCTVEATDVLAEPSTWRPLGTIQLTNDPMPWTDTTAASGTNRFYRARLGP